MIGRIFEGCANELELRMRQLETKWKLREEKPRFLEKSTSEKPYQMFVKKLIQGIALAEMMLGDRDSEGGMDGAQFVNDWRWETYIA